MVSLQPIPETGAGGVRRTGRRHRWRRVAETATFDRMKLAFSSLAWEPVQDALVRATLARRGVTGLEVAPLKYWPHAPDVPSATLANFRHKWAQAGIRVVALQGILFGLPELQLFGSPEQRAELERHLVGMCMMAGGLGARIVVFGAPRNRIKGDLTDEEAVEQAASLLSRVAREAHDLGVTLCMEPMPRMLGADFIRTTEEAMHLASVVNHPGFGVHFDSGASALNGESDAVVLRALHATQHYHVSEVDLLPLGAGTVDHHHLGAMIRASNYDHWLSIEMRGSPADPVIETVERAIDVAMESYELW